MTGGEIALVMVISCIFGLLLWQPRPKPQIPVSPFAGLTKDEMRSIVRGILDFPEWWDQHWAGERDTSAELDQKEKALDVWDEWAANIPDPMLRVAFQDYLELARYSIIAERVERQSRERVKAGIAEAWRLLGVIPGAAGQCKN